MNVNYKKTLKFVTLLITSLLIATVSAQVYNYMHQNATITVEGIDLKWINGDDYNNAGTQISGATCSLTNLKGPANGTKIYPDPVRLKATANVIFDLLIDEVTGDTGQMASIIVRLYNVNGSSYVYNMTVWDGTSKGQDKSGLSIINLDQWKFEWEIKWKADATGAVTVKLKVKIPA